MSLFKLIIVWLMVPVLAFSQKIRHDTLYHKYVIEYPDDLREYTESISINHKETIATYYYSPDSLVVGEFFISVGVCVTNYGDPYHFIRLTFLESIDNSLYDYNKPLSLELPVIDKEFKYDSKQIPLTFTSYKKENWGRLTYNGLNLKSVSNIFIVNRDSWKYLCDYNLTGYTIKYADGESAIQGGGMSYFAQDLIELIKKVQIIIL